MEPALVIGILARWPKALPGCPMVGQVRQLDRLVGAPSDYRAAEWPGFAAVAHCLMNGVPRVRLADAGDDWVAGLKALCEEPPLLVLAPGVPDFETRRALAQAFLESDAGCLWLDHGAATPPAEDVLQERRRLGGPAHRIRYAWPAVVGLTPGRPTEAIPAAALIAPLHLGTAHTLAGSFNPPSPAGGPDLDGLKRAGCGVLVGVGYQQRLGLAWPLSRPTPAVARERSALPDRLKAALRDATDPCFDGRPDGPGLRGSLERSARVVLMEFQRRGEITEFTLAVVGRADGPEIEVGYKTPRRVAEVNIRLGQT